MAVMLPEIPSRKQVALAHKRQGGLVAAVLPIHGPRALLRAHGALPIEVWGPPNIHAALGASHLQPYVCSVVTNALSFLLSGGLQVADMILVPHACDSLQGLGSILIDFLQPAQPVLPFYLPRARRESDLDFLTAELRALGASLAELTGAHPSLQDLARCLDQEQAADELLGRLHAARARLPLREWQVFALIRSREFLPAEQFIALVQPVLEADTHPVRTGVPIILSGILPEPRAWVDALDDAGAVIVADDLAGCGRRLYAGGVSLDPYRRMAERLLSGPPDPMLGRPISERVDHLVHLARTTGARGVVFLVVKFCEPELFDLPLVRWRLKEVGLPSIAIEIELNDAHPLQAMTRIEAFVEMLT